ncbi:MAG: hypothetical protein Q8P67_03590 [archaeon]|nr:hypothetical protein [archaeon]
MAYYGAPVMQSGVHPFFMYGKKGMKNQFQIQKKMMKYQRMGYGYGMPPPMYSNFSAPMMGMSSRHF